MNPKLAFVIVLFSVIQYSRGLPLEESGGTDDVGFMSPVDMAFDREIGRVALFDKVIDALDKEIDDIDSDEVIMLKDAHEFRQFLVDIKNELQTYYNNLANEALFSTEVSPNIDKYMFEIKLIEIAPKYIQRFTNELIEDLYDPEENIDLPKKDKKTIAKHFINLETLVVNDLLPAIKSEIEEHAAEWRSIDAFNLLVNSIDLDVDDISEDEAFAIMRMIRIFGQFTTNNAVFLAEFYSDMKQYAEALGIKDLFESSEEWLASSEEDISSILDTMRK